MIEITRRARRKMKEILKDKNIDSPVRIKIGGGCSGSPLVMALDEKRDSDEVFEHRGLTYIIEKEILDDAELVTVDYVESSIYDGFSVTSRLMGKAGTCAGCSRCR